MKDRIKEMVMAGFGRMGVRNRRIMERALAACEGSGVWEYDVGKAVTVIVAPGSNDSSATILARYRIKSGASRYVVLVQAHGTDIIVSAGQLSAHNVATTAAEGSLADDTLEFQRRTEAILARLRRTKSR